ELHADQNEADEDDDAGEWVQPVELAPSPPGTDIGKALTNRFPKGLFDVPDCRGRSDAASRANWVVDQNSVVLRTGNDGYWLNRIGRAERRRLKCGLEYICIGVWSGRTDASRNCSAGQHSEQLANALDARFRVLGQRSTYDFAIRLIKATQIG